MQDRWPLLLAAGVGTAWLGFAPEAAALTDKERLEKLERHMLELEKRLEASEAENAKLRAQQAAPAGTAKGAAAGSAAAGQAAAAPDVKALDQKVRLIERKLEVDKENTDAKWAKLPKMELGSQGLKVESADGNNTLYLRSTLQADGRFYVDDNGSNPTNTNGDDLNDQFLIRRARITLEGTLWKYIDYRVMPDFAGSQTRLFDAYVDFRPLQEVSLTAGKYKAPISLERLQSASALSLTERAFPTQLAPNRDLGLMLHGEFDKPGYAKNKRSFPLFMYPEFIAYQLGVANGSRNNNGDATGDVNDDKEFQGRVFAHPFQHSGIEPLEGLGLGLAGSWGNPNDETLSNYVTPAQNTMFRYASNARADGVHTRIYPQMYWNYGPFGLIGEYAVSDQELASQSVKNNVSVNKYQTTINDQAWNVTLLYVLTGEDNVFLNQGIKPRHIFDPFNGQWGAFQLAARWTEMDFDKAVFLNTGTAAKPVYPLADPRNSVSSASSWALGVNWWLNNNVKFMADYNQTEFDGGAGVYNSKGALTSEVRDRQTEKVFMTRFQVSF
jgi:phosphate-selective porin OprO/OprP